MFAIVVDDCRRRPAAADSVGTGAGGEAGAGADDHASDRLEAPQKPGQLAARGTDRNLGLPKALRAPKCKANGALSGRIPYFGVPALKPPRGLTATEAGGRLHLHVATCRAIKAIPIRGGKRAVSRHRLRACGVAVGTCAAAHVSPWLSEYFNFVICLRALPVAERQESNVPPAVGPPRGCMLRRRGRGGSISPSLAGASWKSLTPFGAKRVVQRVSTDEPFRVD
eukprot:5373346-Prymnesium_polylepis.1